MGDEPRDGDVSGYVNGRGEWTWAVFDGRRWRDVSEPLSLSDVEALLDDRVELRHYSAALDEVFRLRRALAAEATMLESLLELRTFPGSRRVAVVEQVGRMREAARGRADRAYAVRSAELAEAMCAAGASETLTRSAFERAIDAAARPYPGSSSATHGFPGSDPDRQSVGVPGHCEDCARYGHVRAHPDLGCADVGCVSAHGPDEEREVSGVADPVPPWAVFEDAADRVDYRLTFGELAGSRRFHPSFVEGPDLSDAREPGRVTSGDWCGDDLDEGPDGDAETWFAHFAGMVVGEAVHEALEWFRVDGGLWLDPHGEHERAIHEAVDVLTTTLARLRAEKEVSGGRS